MARKRIDIDFTQMDKLLAMQATLKEVAFYFNCSEDTVERATKREKGMTFEQYRDIKKQGGLISLRRNIWQMSAKVPSVAIFLSKNYLGLTDKVENEVNVQSTTKIDFSDISSDDLRRLAGEDDDEDEI